MMKDNISDPGNHESNSKMNSKHSKRSSRTNLSRPEELRRKSYHSQEAPSLHMNASPSSLSLCSLYRDFGTGFKKGELTEGSNCWAEPVASEIEVRSKDYLKTSIKQPSAESFCDLVDVDVFRTNAEGRYDEFAESMESYTQFALSKGEKRFLLIMHFQSPIYNMACTFALNQQKFDKAPESTRKLWNQFVNGTDEFRDERFKVIPRLIESHWMLKAACGSTKPILYATKLKHRWKKTDDYLEIMCDTGSSTIASKLATMSIGTATKLTFDMALLIEGRDEEELPEHIIGVFRLCKPDLKHSRVVVLKEDKTKK